MIHTHHTEPDWLAARRWLITASDIPNLLGEGDPDSPWFRTPDEVFAEKVGLMEPKTVGPEVHMWREAGHRVEPVLRTWYADVTGRETKHLGNYTIVTSDTHPWFGATLDMTAWADAGWAPIQLKNCGYSQRSKWLTKQDGKRTLVDDGVRTPLEKAIQVQAEIFAMDAQWGGIAALLGGNTFLVREFPRHEEFIQKRMLPAAEALWKRMQEYREQEIRT